MTEKFCPNCNFKNGNEDKFCQECGSPLDLSDYIESKKLDKTFAHNEVLLYLHEMPKDVVNGSPEDFNNFVSVEE